MSIKLSRLPLLLLFTVILIRLFTLQAYPLMDTTEARYAEIGRIMHETGDWITPYIDYDVPFWGKPPLSFWLTATSYKLFGISEFSARFPSWLCGIATLLLLSTVSKSLGVRRPSLVMLICASSAIFFISMGAVMTEASLVLGVTLCLVSAIKVLIDDSGNRFWAYLFFVGLALGMLAKGPIAVILSGSPLVFWALMHRNLKKIWASFPWVSGAIIFFVLSLPWYLMAETKTPGFLNYFLVGEHFLRFVESGWSGDLYGSAHEEFRGKIWILWLFSAFPWSFLFLGLWIKKLTKTKTIKKTFYGWQEIDFFLFYFSVFPMLFFTFSGNILATYVVPGIPAFSLLLARRLSLAKSESNSDFYFQKVGHWNPGFQLLALCVPALFLVLVSIVSYQPNLAKTEKSLINAAHKANSEALIFYLDKMEFSARFYSDGQADNFRWDPMDYSAIEGNVFAVAKNSEVDYEEIISKSREIFSNKRYRLYELTESGKLKN